MRYVLGIGGVMSFYGIAGLAVLLSGKYLGVRPSMQIVIFVMLLLTLPIALVGGFFVNRKAKKKKKLAEEAKKEEADGDAKPGAEKPAAPSGNYAELSSSGGEVVEFLKGSNLGAAGKEAVYSLPWYLVIGGNGSGKTSLILGSDLNFQSLPSQRQSELNLVRPTKQIDWRMTSDAVFIDTAGRLQSDADQDEWSSLVEAIKKYRPKRPLDGLLLTVNTELILAADERDIEEQAKAIRARLDDATKRLKAKFPVYLVFTHADAIEGFRDSFSMSKKDGENLVWGSTFPLANSENSQALFDSEYEILQESVMKRRLIRLSAPFSPVRQLRIFNFPLHFGSARRKLGTFVSTMFRPNPFSESPFLRGFYFTATPANTQRGRGKPGNVPKTIGDSYFTRKFFKDVVLRDKDLVRTFADQKKRAPMSGWVLTTIATVLVFTFLTLSGLSLYNNQRLVDDAAKSGEEVIKMLKADKGKDPFKKSAEDVQLEIEKLESLRKEVERLDKYEREGPPFWYRFGFYSGSKIFRERLMQVYYVGVERRFRQPTLTKLNAQLKQFSQTPGITSGKLTPEQEKTLETNYDLLKAYLMLTSDYKEFSEQTAITSALENIWVSEAKLPDGSAPKAKAHLDFYFKQIDRDKSYDRDTSGFPRIAEDKDLVRDVRKNLAAFPAYLQYLKITTAEANKEIDGATIDSLIQGRSQGVMTGTYQVPGAYTIEGYRQFMKQSLADAAGEMNKNDWVMGKKNESAQASEAELKNLRDKYFNDYTDHWRKLIRGVQIIKYNTPENLSASLSAFSDTDSPMKLLLSEIAKNTDFSTNAESKGWLDLSWITDWFSGKGGAAEGETKNVVEREFRPLFDFIGSGKEDDKNSTGITKYGSVIKNLNDELGNISASEKTAITNELIAEKGSRYTLIKRAENNVSDIARGFESQAGKEIATLLTQPVDGVREYFGAGAKDQLEKDWNQTILTKARGIETGYPFTSDGEADLAKLTAFLNPESGDLSKFYKARLERYFEEVNGELKVKEASDVKFSPAFVSYLNRAFALRKALFGDSPTPNFEYDFRLLPVENALIEVAIDGQTVKSDSTGSNKLKFPAATGTSTGVLMRVSSTGGETLPGSQPSANPPTSSVNSSSTSPPVSNYQADSGSDGLKFQGTWGLFKFFDAGSPSKESSGEYLLTYTLDGKTVKATIKPTGGDLFDKSVFTNVKAPDKMLN